MDRPKDRPKTHWITTWLLGLTLAVVATAPYVPVLLWGRPGLGHDLQFHHAHLQDFMQSLQEGVLYPRWAAAMNSGYGAPTFLFYPPLPYYLAASASWITGDLATGFFLAAAALSVFGSACLYRLIRRTTGPAGAWIGAALFAWMPYALLDMYHRFAWAEFNALMWLPAVVLALLVYIDRPGGRRLVALVAVFSALASSHLVTCLTAGPFLLALVAYEALGRRSWRMLLAPVLPAVLALLVVAGFLLPVFLEQKGVHLDHITTSRHGQYGRNFLFHDEVAAGFTHSFFKPTVAWAALSQTLILIGAGLALAWRRRLLGLGAFVLAAGLLHAFLTTVLSEPVWRILPLLGTIQFPWRLTGALGLLAAWLTGLAWDRGLRPRLGFSPAVLMLVVPILAALSLSAREIHTTYHPDEDWMVDQRARMLQSSVLAREYIPADVELGNLLRFTGYDPDRRTVEIRGQARFTWSRWEPHERRAHVQVGTAGAEVVFPIFRFPGWSIRVDGQDAEPEAANALRLIEMRLPPGDHDLVIQHRPTAPRTIGLWLGLVGILLTAGAGVFTRGRGARAVPAARPYFTGRRGAVFVVPVVVLLALPLVFPVPYEPPHVVLLTAPGLRADHAHFNGYQRPTTKNLDFLALTEGVRFRRAYTPVPDTARIAETMLVDSGLLARLRARGYTLGAFLGEDLPAASPSLARAFPEARVPRRPRTPAAEVVARAMLWVRQHQDQPLFLWIHLAETRGPFRPGPERIFTSGPGPRLPLEALPPAMRVRGPDGPIITDMAVYRDLYDEAVVDVDQNLGRFINDLYKLGLYDRALILFAGLTGFDLGDGPTPLVAGGSLIEGQTAVMLVAKFPANRHMGCVVNSDPVSLQQLVPTIDGWLEPGEIPARSLERTILGEKNDAGVEVQLPDASERVRVFPGFKVRWKSDAPPSLWKWLPWPPWEEPWQGPVPEEARRWLEPDR